MSKGKDRIAVFPGTFDPLTNGHLDVIRRGARIFDELVVGVGVNPDKQSLLPQDIRAEIVRRAAAGLDNVRVEEYAGLTVDFVRKVGSGVILRGLRAPADLPHELQAAMTNRAVTGVETVFILTSPEYAFISSSLVRQIAREGGDVSSLVPPAVLPHIRQVAPRPRKG